MECFAGWWRKELTKLWKKVDLKLDWLWTGGREEYKMVVVRAGKFQMRLVTFMLVTNGKILKEPMSWDEARDKVFKGITGVEATDEEFREINTRLKRCPVYKPFKIEGVA